MPVFSSKITPSGKTCLYTKLGMVSLAAEQVTSSETTVMKALLTPVVALEVPVLGTITDAQESELQAVEQLWPKVPHQVCQFHALRDASQPAFEADKKLKTAMRKRLRAISPRGAQAAQAADSPGLTQGSRTTRGAR